MMGYVHTAMHIPTGRLVAVKKYNLVNKFQMGRTGFLVIQSNKI